MSRKLTDRELKKLQKVEYEILCEFDRICNKHNLKYTLCGGTLLGAIRHNGFIPWDDDIDVHMPRKDYNLFIKYQKKDLNKNKYYLDCMETKDDCGMLYAKLKRKDSIYMEELSDRDVSEQNIWIDIFPIDNITDNKIIQKLFYTRVYCLKIILMYQYGYIKTHKNKNLFRLVKILSVFYNKKRLKRKLSELVIKYNNKKTKNVACYSGVYLGKEIFDNDIHTDLIKHKFENKEFYITKHYDKYLKGVYGDYMKLPPKEQREGHHYVTEIKFPN